MAQHESAKKRARQTVTRNLRNRACLSKVKTAVKKFQVGLAGLKAGQTTAEEATKLLASAQSFLHKAATKGVLHKNNASRHIARLTHALTKAQKPA